MRRSVPVGGGGVKQRQLVERRAAALPEEPGRAATHYHISHVRRGVTVEH